MPLEQSVKFARIEHSETPPLLPFTVFATESLDSKHNYSGATL